MLGLRRRQPTRPAVVEHIAEWARDHPEAQFKELLPPRRLERVPPSTVEATIDDEYSSRLVANQHGKFLVTLADARLVGGDGLIALPDGSYVAESVYDRSRLDDPAAAVPRFRRRARKSGAYFSLLATWAHGNYYHWLHDTLLRLYRVIEHLPADTKFIVPADLKPFQRETLNLLAVSDERIVRYPADEEWQLETLYFSNATTNSGSDRREASEWLRELLLDGLGVVRSTGTRRVYISRQHVPMRRVVNEDEVIAFLAGYGFEAVSPERLSLREQATLFADADTVVAAHGSGLMNVLFSPEGLNVVDIIPEHKMPWAYTGWTLAAELGHNYWYFVAESVDRPGAEQDCRIPLDKLAATIEAIGLTP